VGSILDLAVVVLAVMVCVSMGLLAWTLGVSITGGHMPGRWILALVH
jgi:hypothetical protein